MIFTSTAPLLGINSVNFVLIVASSITTMFVFKLAKSIWGRMGTNQKLLTTRMINMRRQLLNNEYALRRNGDLLEDIRVELRGLSANVSSESQSSNQPPYPPASPAYSDAPPSYIELFGNPETTEPEPEPEPEPESESESESESELTEERNRLLSATSNANLIGNNNNSIA